MAILVAILAIGVVFISPNKKEEKLIAVRVVDGDTIEISTGEIVRYIGIDTPEKGECYYEEAKEMNEDLVLNKEVRLESDKSDKDKYGRLLRYVYVGNNLINETLVRYGYAVYMPVAPDLSLAWIFEWEEKEAKDEQLGLWANCYGNGKDI